jgi:hypothetical protein
MNKNSKTLYIFIINEDFDEEKQVLYLCDK